MDYVAVRQELKFVGTQLWEFKIQSILDSVLLNREGLDCLTFQSACSCGCRWHSQGLAQGRKHPEEWLKHLKEQVPTIHQSLWRCQLHHLCFYRRAQPLTWTTTI
jgi:hypothetical protein